MKKGKKHKPCTFMKIDPANSRRKNTIRNYNKRIAEQQGEAEQNRILRSLINGLGI